MDPSAISVRLPSFAAAVGAPEPPRISEQEALETVGPDVLYYATRLRGGSNAKAKRELGFVPRRLEWLIVLNETGEVAEFGDGRHRDRVIGGWSNVTRQYLGLRRSTLMCVQDRGHTLESR